MKKISFVAIAIGMFFGAGLCADWPPQEIEKNEQIIFNAPPNFGKTHFIVGYENPPQELSNNATQQILVNQKPFIVDGSSAHLIDESRNTQSFFTSIHEVTSIILYLLEQAQKSITVAAFALTDVRIADALINAHKRGVVVYIIVDGNKAKDRYSKVQKLVTSNLEVWCYDPSLRPHYKKKDWSDPLMHHKCFVIDNVVITGSYNATKAAQADNIENINILRDPHAVEEHRQEFTRLKTYCKRCKKK